MPFSSSDIRGFNGLGKGIELGSAKSGISQGSQVAGFDANCIVYSGAVQGSAANGTISLSPPGGGAGNGIFIRNLDDKATFGQVTAGGFAASDQFGGCDVTILKGPGDTFWSTHVYSSDACRKSVAAVPSGWSVVGTWSSKGYIEKHPNLGGLVVFSFFEDNIKIITVGIGGYPGAVMHVGIAAMFDA